MPIECRRITPNNDLYVELIGEIADAVEFPHEKVQLSEQVIVDCSKIKYFNSYAILKWTDWVRKFDPRIQFVLKDVPTRMVDLMNRIGHFLPLECVVTSFYVPYVCENCNNEEDLILIRGKDFVEEREGQPERIMLPDQINCQKCKSFMKFSSWDDKYLSFLKKSKLS